MTTLREPGCKSNCKPTYGRCKITRTLLPSWGMLSRSSARSPLTMLPVCSTPMMSRMCRLPIMRWNSALAQFAGMNDVLQAAPRFRVWSCAGLFEYLLLLLPTLNVCVFRLSNCTIHKLGITCEITLKLDTNSIGCNSAFAKIRRPISLPPRISSSRLLCHPRIEVHFHQYSADSSTPLW